MFITPAFAQGTGAVGSGLDIINTVAPFAVIFVIMYFLVIRPQRQKLKQHQEMIKNIRRGDTIVTNGGLIGKVVKVVDENELQVEFAEGVRARQHRGMIAEVRAKGEPVKDEAAA
jgi:preprotein translocase subunit YajC